MLVLIMLISLVVAVLAALVLGRSIDVIDRRAAHRINSAEEPARKLSAQAEERVGGVLERLVPAYVRRIRSDLYWASLADSRFQSRSAAPRICSGSSSTISASSARLSSVCSRGWSSAAVNSQPG